ncbi:MAG: FAD-dependent oxidoreductase [Bacteroidetes bacterium]|nr:FAD-dependent oxidoreductase [Bacteroidota bacterium]
MRGERVTVVGGGLAGMSASAFLGSNGYDVTLIESTHKLGGRTFSFYDEETGLTLDNGQHILAGWYDNAFEFLKTIGKEPKFRSNPNLEVYFREPGGGHYEFKAKGDNPFIAVAKGFIDYHPLTLIDKYHLLSLRELIELDIAERLLRGKNLSWLLDHLKQTENLKKYFWEPFVFAVFNTSPEYVDASIFLNVLVKSFDKFGSMSLIIPDETLDELFVAPFEKYAAKNINLMKNTKALNFKVSSGRVESVMLEGGAEIESDYFISAVPFHSFPGLFKEDDYRKYFHGVEGLKPASIVSIFIVPEKMPEGFNNRFYHGMIGLLGTKAHWIFFKKDYICAVISAPEYTVDGYDEIGNDALCDTVVSEIRDCFPEFRDIGIRRVKYFREKRATFLPSVESAGCRPDNSSGLSNLFIAGDWTNTGLPATIEGAATSARKCSELIMKKN